MSTSRNPSHGRSRICNAAQMERKRILDREHQRLRRQKAKRLSEMIQAEMSDLRQDLTFALEILDRLYQLVARCTTFIREPTWVAVSGFSSFQPRRFEPDEKDRFTKDPKALHTFRPQADYICKRITRIQQQGIKSIEVTKEAVDDFIEHKDQYMKDMVWNEDCRSWYKGNTADGKIVALWPGSTLHYIDTLRQVRYEDFKVQYFGNYFSYLGNGMSKLEMAPDADLAYYIRQRDDAPIIGSKFVYKKAGPELAAINMTAAKASEETTTDVSRLKFTSRVRHICIPQAYLCIYTIESSPSLDNHPIRVQ
ncbi:hypothetical protein AFGD_011533 [Aspergillus flavus]|nr:hypothetical protein AFGD_011533 [Aspergillus flavus]